MKIVFLLAMLVGCSTGKKVGPSYKEVNDIKNSDFKQAKPVRYKRKNDIYKNVTSPNSSLTNKESIQRVIKYEGDLKLETPIGKISRYCYENKFDEAFMLVKENNKKYLKNPMLWNQVGTCYLLKNDRRKALLFYNKALSLKRNYGPALNNLGVMYFNEGDHSRSLVAFKKAIRSGNFNTVPKLNLAHLYLTYGLADEAINLVKGFGKNTQDVDVLNILATAYLIKNDLDKSLFYYGGIANDFHERAEFGINYAVALFQKGKKGNARDVIEDLDKKYLKGWESYLKESKRYMGIKND